MRLRYVEDLTQGQVAARLGVPEGTVKVRLHRARARLRGVAAELAA
jgi:RNA polymerase sigma-70 factor (ECF subfamily)